MNKKKTVLTTFLIGSLYICGAIGIGLVVQAEKQGVPDSYPYIEVEYPTADEVPYAVVGESYEVFPAKAIGEKASHTFEMTTKVYFNYYTDSPINISLVDGKFVPTTGGVYTILYKAARGTQETEYEVDITAYDQSPLQIALPGLTQDYTIADGLTLESPTITENSGEYSITAKAICGDKQYELEKTGDSFSYKLMKAGTHRVQFTYTDYVQTVTKSMDITVGRGTGYQVKEADATPKYLVKNASYSFGSIIYYDKSDEELVEKTAEVKYSLDKGAETAYTIGDDLVINASSSLTLAYYSGSNKIIEKQIAVLDAGYDSTWGKVDTSKLFVVKSGSMTRTDSNEAKDTSPIWTTSQGGTLAFANKLIVEKFSLDVVFKKSGANQFNVFLSDYYDEENVLAVSIYPRSDGASSDVYVNGHYLGKANGYYPNGNVFNIRYLCASNVLVVAGATMSLEGYFNGMSRGCANLEISVDDVQSETSLSVESINSQPIGRGVTVDYINAMAYTNINGVYHTINSVLTFYMQVADVYSPSASATFSVQAPDNSYVKSLDNEELKNRPVTQKDYSVVLTEYGRYKITVSTNDGLDNKISYTTYVYVYDDVEPEVFVEVSKTSVKVGESITITASALDALDGSCSVQVVMFNPASVGERLTGADGKYSYTFNRKGTYLLCVYGEDSTGNQTTKIVAISVKEA